MHSFKRFGSYHTLLMVSVLLSFLSCKKDDIENNDLNKQINSFIWKNMQEKYLWTADVPNLDSAKKTEMINKYTDHEKLFYDILYSYPVTDRVSCIVDDYRKLENAFSGITLSTGMYFHLAGFYRSSELYGYVCYVIKGSPADIAGIKRGDLFDKINDQQITRYNYKELLNKNSYTVCFAKFKDNLLVSNGRKIKLTAVEIQENPIFMDTTYVLKGRKIAYLMYNQFTPEYDEQLNNVFKRFKDQSVDDLILDLRYNSGGSMLSAVYLASMIYSTDTNKLFARNIYNTSLQEYFDKTFGPEYSKMKFADKIKKSDADPGVQINSLGLNTLYVITAKRIASTSELLIHCLKPYMMIMVFGDSISGKPVGSMTIKDYDENGNLNTKHKWAMQPAVLKCSNANGETDFTGGMIAYYGSGPLDEDYSLLPLGRIEEFYTRHAIDRIFIWNTGWPYFYPSSYSKKSASAANEFKFSKVADSKDFIPHAKEMYLDDRFFKKIRKR